MLVDELKKRKEELEKVIDYIERTTGNISVQLKCIKKRGKVECYIKDEKDSDYKYSPDIEFAKKIAQDEYNQKILALSKAELKHIEKLLKYENDDAFIQAYENLSPGRKELVQPYRISNEEYARVWQAEEYEGNTKWEMKTQYITRRKDVVRSRAEMIIADALYSLGIPYKYEYPITFENGVTFYSDFAALNVRERKAYRIEHLGMMSDSEYSINSLEKIEMYEKNGVLLGRDLILTFDKDGKELDSNLIEMKLRKYLL